MLSRSGLLEGMHCGSFEFVCRDNMGLVIVELDKIVEGMLGKGCRA